MKVTGRRTADLSTWPLGSSSTRRSGFWRFVRAPCAVLAAVSAQEQRQTAVQGSREFLRRRPTAVIYLIGFSRGAFTVRVLAGLIHRCGLLRRDHPHVLSRRSEQAYRSLTNPTLRTPEEGRAIQVRRARPHTRACVSSGSGTPSSRTAASGRRAFPTCARNPSVEIVVTRVARRTAIWFFPTSWGGIPISPRPRKAAEARPQPSRRSGSRWHSDVGGGVDDDAASRRHSAGC